MTILSSTNSIIRSVNRYCFKQITTFSFLSQDTQLADADILQPSPPPLSPPLPPPSPPLPPPSPSSGSALPPNPATGSPLYLENWRSPIPSASFAQSLVPFGLFEQSPSSSVHALSQTLDVESLMNVFADWMTSQRWADLRNLFESWIRSLDKFGKPNKPDVNLYNHYLRANLMLGAAAGDLLDLMQQMEDYDVVPNTASYNLVLKAMYQFRETGAAQKLLERMLQTGKDSLPDDESFDLITSMLFLTDEVDAALKYIEMMLKAGYMLSLTVFNSCIQSCVTKGKFDTLVSVIDKCKEMDQNKALCPKWKLCNHIADVAIQSDNSKLAFCALEYMARWIARGEIARPPIPLSVDQGLLVSALSGAGRTYSSTLLDASWAILRRSLRQKRPPSPESYMAKIHALSSMGSLQKAFSTLREFETDYCNSSDNDDWFCPFTSLYPVVVACTKKGFETLDSVYFQLENLSRSTPPYKSVTALNCVILGCANAWDLDRAYQTFEAIGSTFDLTPNIHSFNALMCAFGKLKKTFEAARVFEHLTGLGIKPNSKSYSLLVDAHLVNRDAKAAISVIGDMVDAGFVPTREMLKKVRRRSTREMDYESRDRADSISRDFRIGLGSDNRRDILFTLQYSMTYT